MKRRTFLGRAALAGGGALVAGLPAVLDAARGGGPGERVQVGVAGVRGRGNNLLRTFAAREDVDVRHVCDVDTGVCETRAKETHDATGRTKPATTGDFRRVLDDASIDVLVLGTPDHWHAIPAILACQAEKDVYTEKPDGHNLLESFTMARAAERHERVVQLGTQARSAPHMHEAMEYLRSGAIGRARYATAWESARQGALGRPADSDPPAGVDYDFWLGPAPRRPFNPLRFHGNWRWFFDYGTGDLGNDGVHRIDYARWGLASALAATGEELPAYPGSVSAHGGKLYFDDAQEWPDTLLATFDYGRCLLSYELRVWSPYPLHGAAEGAAIYGDKGYVVLSNSWWRAFGNGGERAGGGEGSRNLDQTELHVEDFLGCVRTRERPAADLATVGHPSSALCHLGNIAWRRGRTVRLDPKSAGFPDDAEAHRLRTREKYREPWVLPGMDEV